MTIPVAKAALTDPVTRHLRRDFTCFTPEQTVGEALAHMRAHPPEGRIIYFYVIDAERRLCGVVPTRRLLLSPLDTRIADIMVRQVIAVPSPASDVAFSPDGRMLAVGGGVMRSGERPVSSFAQLWDVGTGRMLERLNGHPATVRRLLFSPDGSRLATLEDGSPAILARRFCSGGRRAGGLR